MRPTELRVRNFRSYAGEHEFDFSGRNLVAVVGPIGSGKSSLLDAIVFALYGRTPRIANATRSLINQRAADASVLLRFEVEGELWEAARSIRIKGPSKHALYRYEDPDAEPVEKLTLEGEVNTKIVDLLGLDFAAFERSVLLAQGRFAEFLQARPADRDRVLKGVFGHDRIDRMKGVAKERRDRASLELEKLQVRLQRFDEIEQRLASSKTELDEASHRLGALEKVAAKVVELDERTAAVSNQAREAADRLRSLDQHTVRLPDSASTKQALAEASRVEGRRRDLAQELDAAQAAAKTADDAHQKVIAAGEPAVIEKAAALLAAADPQLKAVVAADRRLAAAKELLAEAAEAKDKAVARLSEAENVRDQSLGRAAEAAKIVEEAAEALERGRHADMAATLRSGLHLDSPCPVCEQLVETLPDGSTDAHLDELERVHAAAGRTKGEVDATYTSALATLERIREQVATAKEKLEAAANQVGGAEEDTIRARGDLEETNLRLEKLLGPGDPSDNLQQRREGYESLSNQRDEAMRQVEQIRGRHDQAIRDEQEAHKSLQELGRKLADLAARLELPLEIGEDATAIEAALETLRAAWSRETAGLRSTIDECRSEQEKLAAERTALLGDVAVDGEIGAAIAVVGDRIKRLEKQVAEDEAELAKAEDLKEKREELTGQVGLFARINSDLTDSRFIRFLLDEERARLAELGSEHFQRLSAGRYRFADDQFGIVDLTAADSTRRADSLSGGETFLASLGLALALAEMVAGTGGRLDAFFLDEGFGTLDPEHLDLAMEGVESLVADQSNRLVVIVSHVPELRDRIEDLIVLERSATTGDTKVISG